MNDDKIRILTTKILTKHNDVPGDFLNDLLECWSKGEAVVSNEKSPFRHSDGLRNEDNNFTSTTSISDYLKSCGKVDLNEALGWEYSIGDSIEDPQKVADWWCVNQLCKEARPGACKKFGKVICNNLH